MGVLERIVEYKREFIARRKEAEPLAVLERAVSKAPAPRGFAAALKGRRGSTGERVPGDVLRIVAEVKKASPSKGIIRADFDPAEIARSYEAGGAAGISVLTDEKFFQGSLENLRRVRAAVSLPVLRKEFILDPYQIVEARAAGADAVLLIAGMIPWNLQRELRRTAREQGLDVLLEIHGPEELEPAMELEPDVLGVNNRDLRSPDLRTDLAVSEALAASIPAGVVWMSESGIRDRADIARLAALGADAALVGEHLMREPDPGAAIWEKLGCGRPLAAAGGEAVRP